MRFTIHNGLKTSIVELNHRRKPRTEITNIFKDNKNYPSDWATLNVSVPSKQIPIYVARNEKGEVTDLILMAKKRKTPCCATHKSPKRAPVKPVGENFQHPYTFQEPEKIIGRELQKTTENCRRRY